jgi:hypothetical protein
VARNNANIIISAEDKTKQAFASVNKSLGNITALSGAAVLAAGGALAAIAKSTANFNDQMIKSAQAVGTSTEELSGLAYGAKLAGVEFDQLTTGLGKLAKTSEAYRDGLSSAVDAFNKIDLDPTQFTNTSQLFEAVADRLSKLPDGANKTAIAMALLGRSGAKLIPLMNGGADAIRAATEEAEQFGRIVSTDVAKQSERFNDNITRIQTAAEGLKISIGNAAIPALVEITDAMVLATKESGLLYGAWIGLGGLAANLFGLDFTSQAQKRIKQITNEVDILQRKLNSRQAREGSGIIPISEQEYQKALKRMKELGEERFRLEQGLKRNTSTGTKPTASNNDEATVLGATTTAVDKQAQAVAKLVAEFERAVAPTQSQSEALQEQLNIFKGLQPEVQAYLQGLQKQVEATELATKAQEEWNELYNLQRASDDEALSRLEELSAAEVARVEAMEAQAKTIRELYDPTLKLLDLQYEYQQLLLEGLITQEEYDFALKKSQESISNLADEGAKDFKDLQREIEGFSRNSANELSDFLADGEDDFSDFVDSVLKNLARLAIKRNITDPLFKGLEGIFGGGDSGSGGGFFSDLFGGFRANGGPVSSNKAYIVGERGPELLTGVTGSIIPNHALGGSGVTVNIIGAERTPQIRKSQTPDGGVSIDVIFDMIKGEMTKDIRREGEFAQVLENQYGLNRVGGTYG